jgi:hypothetical protein
VPTGRTGEDVRTEVNVLDVGPDLQFIANPGEAFPALMLGSPWGIEDVGCPNRPNPPVPTWHAGAGSRFQVGLANDMIGYEIPAWAFSAIPGAFTNEPPYDDACVNDMDDKDPAGHQHKLETEGVGPTASNMVAERLTALLDQTPDAGSQIVRGRYVKPDGSLSRRPEGAAGIWFADAGSSTLAPGTGTIVASTDVGFFGSRAVDANGQFIDYDGVRQSGPDITTRGMARSFPLGPRYYLDVYPALTTTPLGAAQPPLPPDQPGQPEQPPAPCPAFAALPQTSLASDDISVGTGHLHLSGTSAAGDNPCGEPAHIDHVDVAVAKRVGRHRCRFFSAEGELGKRRPCRQRHLIPAQGTEQYSLDLDAHLRAGRYSAIALATDSYGAQDLPGQGNRAPFRVR